MTNSEIKFNNSFFNPTLHIDNPCNVIICSDLHLGTNNPFIKNFRQNYNKDVIDFIGKVHWTKTILTLGDLFDGEYDSYFPLNRVISLRGNHCFPSKHTKNITWLPDGTKLTIGGEQKMEIVLTHRPYTEHFSRGVFNLCGHLHGQHGFNPVENSFDCSIENALRMTNGTKAYFELSELLSMLDLI